MKRPRQMSPSPFALGEGRKHPLRPLSPFALDPFSVLPDPVAWTVLKMLRPAHVASSCSLVSRRWRELAVDPELWRAMCSPRDANNALRQEHAAQVLGGWRALFGRLFGSNLVACAHFERIDHVEATRRHGFRSETPSSSLPPFTPSHGFYLEQVVSAGAESAEEMSTLSHWSTDKRHGLVFLPQGATTNAAAMTTFSSATSSVAQCGSSSASSQNSLPVAGPHSDDVSAMGARCCPPLPPPLAGFQEAASAGRRSDAPGSEPGVVATTSDGWCTLTQHIGMLQYPAEFLDSCPVIEVGGWCATAAAHPSGAAAATDATVGSGPEAHQERSERLAPGQQQQQQQSAGAGDSRESVVAIGRENEVVGSGASREEEEAGKRSGFRLQLAMNDGRGNELFRWESEPVTTLQSVWTETTGRICGYPKGVRGLVLSVSGCHAKFSAITAHFLEATSCQ